MIHRSLWFFGAITLVLGGCIIGYPLDQYSTESSSSDAASSSSSGGGGSPNSSSSSGGGAGGAGGGMCTMATPLPIICKDRDLECSEDCYRLNWAEREGNGANAFAHGVAVDSMGNVAIVGEYNNELLPLGGSNAATLPGTPTDGTPFKEGFVIRYTSTGVRQWAIPLNIPSVVSPSMNPTGTTRTARAAAFDTSDDLIVVGRETNGQDKPSTELFINKYKKGEGGKVTLVWLTKSATLGGFLSEAFAVAVNGIDFYVLGRTASPASTISCGGKDLALKAGLFVAKFNGINECQWLKNLTTSMYESSTPVAITARNPGTNGVWITGTINDQLDISPLNGLIAAGPQTFLVSLNDGDGSIRSGLLLPGGTVVTGLDSTGEVVGGMSTLFLTGSQIGPTAEVPSLGSTQKSGFLKRLTVRGPMGGDAGAVIASHTVPFFGPVPTDQVVASQLTRTESKIYVAGIFGGSIKVGPIEGDQVVSGTGAVPILATLDAMGETWLAFDDFATGSDMDPFDVGRVTLGGNGKQLALAGGWRNSINLSTPDAAILGLKDRIGAAGNSLQIFLGYFNAP